MSLSIRTATAIAGVLMLSLSACGKIDPSALLARLDKAAQTPAQTTRAEALDPIFASPQLDDLYAAELTYFSAYDFEMDGEPAFGLMRVIAVHDDRITLNTQNTGWYKARKAINDLRGDVSGIEWDEDEDIQIYRNELSQLVADGKILDARRG